WYFASDELLPMFVHTADGQAMPNPRGRELDRRRKRDSKPPRGGRRVVEKRARMPLRTEVLDRLNSEDMLPAIYFIFSRKGCDEAVRQCLRDGLRLTNPDERQRIIEYADLRVAELSPNELDVLGYDEWIAGLARGVAAHHAGMIPPFKEAVEVLFSRGLVKAVFATETLALGINMPARSVVIESLMKFTGEKHEQLTPGQYTQFSGRAGRRGLDELGHCVVLLQRFIPFEGITRLASTRTYPLVSSFQPSYNMAVNLVRNYTLEEAEHLVNSSFAQFQADRDVVRLEQTKERSAAYLASYRERMDCDRGDINEYRDLLARRQALEDRGGRAGQTRGGRVLEAVNALRPGDVIYIASGKRQGRYAVLEVTQQASERRPRILALSETRTMVRFTPNDFRDPPMPRARLELPKGFHTRDPKARRHLARKLADIEMHHPRPVRQPGDDDELKALDRAIESHPVHGCPELGRHLHYAERATRLEKEISGVDRRVRRRTGTLARRFELVLEILEHLDYVKNWTLANKGDVLRAVYNESDLLVVEALEIGLLDDLDAPELAAVCSTLVYEPRGPETGVVYELPTRSSKTVWFELMRLWRQIKKQEELRGLDLTREPDAGFAQRVYKWASGAPLEDVLGPDDPAGDFVRVMKQLTDLLRQLEDVAPSESLRNKVRAAIDGVQRGVVAYSSVDI
ncbi:MAG: ATP-dependent helicase HelY, partial [Actinomycetota bacterium]|nr:ATP-dependent helicase HelY [Actinomycetota bacterium]